MVKLTPLLLLFSILAAAQTSPPAPAEIQTVNIFQDGGDLKIEITMSQAVQPTVMLAAHPDRLVLDFPNTSSGARQQHKDVNRGGVQSIRFGLNSSTPLVTRMVIDLDEYRPHAVNANGNKVVVSIPGVDKVSNRGPRKGAPVPAASGSILGRLHRKPQSRITYGETITTLAPVTPPPALPPLQLPPAQANAATSERPAPGSRPTAAHPNYGSLQQGTVFPNVGAPGTGSVPPVSNSNPIVGYVTAENSPARRSTNTAVSTASSFPAANTANLPPSKQATIAPALVATPAGTAGTSMAAPSSAISRVTPAASDAVTTSALSSKGSDNPPASSPIPAKAQAPSAPGAAISAQPANSAAERKLPSPAAPDTATTPVAAKGSIAGSAPVASNTSSNRSPAQPVLSIPAEQTASNSASTENKTSVVGSESLGNTVTTETIAADPSLPVLATRQPNSDVRMSFRVKYVAEGAAYLDGGKSAGLSEGMKLEIRDITGPAGQAADPSHPGQQVIADLEVISVAETSAVTQIHEPQRDVKPGDYAFLSSQDTESLIAQRSLSSTRKYPTVISFTEGDPLDEEAREYVPRPPLPEINRARGRIGFDYSSIVSHGAFSSTSSSTGLMMRTDITRIGGTYWNLNGYWRGRLTHSSSAGQATLQDLLNRTYTLALTYDNPNSPWVAGFGRLYLPYATSLDTIDGGYFGRRVNSVATLGVFAGSTPDPTSWSYNPNQEIGGAFVNFQGGSFDATRYTSTAGVGLNMLKWNVNRPFIFFENGIYYKRLFSIYSAVQADRPAANAAVSAPGAGLSRSFTSLRIQPIERLEFDVNHTYFRDMPTFDPTLIGTGLLDKYLFQGFSFGPRVEVLKDIWLYSSFGRSSRTGDPKASWNQMYGITFGHVPWTRVRADVHYSKFDSSFGAGKYSAFSLSRNFKDNFRWELLAGIQSYSSALATSNRSHFVTGNFEAPLGPNFFLQGGYTWNRGGTQNYDQYLISIGYRFDSKYKSTR